MSIRLSNAARARLRGQIKEAANQANQSLPIALNTATKAELIEMATFYGIDPAAVEREFGNDSDNAPTNDNTNDNAEDNTEVKTAAIAAPEPVDPVEAAALADVAALQALVGTMDAAGFRAKALDLARLAHRPAAIMESTPATAGAPRAQARKSGNVVTFAKAFGVTGIEGGQTTDTWVGGANVPAIDPQYVWPEETKIIAAMTLIRKRNIMMAGPAGTGKTTFAEQLAARLGRPFYRISFHGQLEADQIIGQRIITEDGSMVWADGLLLIAMQTAGAVVLLDEIDRARSTMSTVMQSLLDSRYVTVLDTGHTVRCAEGVVFLAAGNTNGTGDETGQYTAAQQMERSTLDRMALTVPIGYMPAAAEQQVLIARTGCTPEVALALVTYANVTRADVAKGELGHGVGLRRLMGLAEAMLCGATQQQALEMAVLNTASPDDREKLALLAKTHLKIEPSAAANTGRGASDFTLIKE